MADVLYVNLDALTQDYNRKIDSAMSKLDSFGKDAVMLGGKLTAAVSLPLSILGFTMIKSASDMEESINKVDVAFKESSASVKAFAKTSLESFGISQAAALDAASLFGDMATSMGFSTQSAAEMSKNLVGLQGDLMSFKNVNDQVAATALKGIFSGETESLKELGIVMTQANVQAFALSKGIKTNIEDMTQAQKVSLRYAYVMDVTKNAQGDFARTQDGSANQMRIFKGLVSEVSTSLGSIMLPIFNSVIHKVNELSKEFLALDENTKTNILIGGGLAIIIGPTLIAIGSIASAISNIGVLLAGLMSPIGIFTVGLVASAAYVLTHWEQVKTFFIGLETEILKLKVIFNSVALSMGFTAQQAFGDMDKAIEKVTRYKGESTNPVAKIVAGMKTATKDIMSFFNELESGGGKMNGATKAVQDYTFEMNLLGLETDQTRKRIADLNAETQRAGQKGFTPNKIANTGVINAEKLDWFSQMANAVGFEGEESTKKLQERYTALAGRISPIVSTGMQKISTLFGDITNENFGMVKGNMEQGFGMLGDVLAQGFTSIFNKDIKFDFKKMIGGFLSALGDMMLRIGAAELTAGILMNIATPGAGATKMLGGGKMLAFGAGLKGGGMAMSANSNIGSSMAGGNFSGGGYGNYSNFNRNQNSSMPKEITVNFANGALKGYMNYQDRKYNG
jgi:hypothetical protein